MAIRIKNNTTQELTLPQPVGLLYGLEERSFPYLEFDKVDNDSRFKDLETQGLIQYVSEEDTVTYSSAWNSIFKFRLGNYHLWVDATGNLRMKNGDATSDLDGTVVNAPAAHGSTHAFNSTDPIPDNEALEILRTCTVGESVHDLVYTSGDNTVAKASALTVATMPCIGIITSKPTPTSCIIVRSGEVTGFTGLTAGTQYFVSTVAGAYTTVPPANPGEVVQRIGSPKNATTLVVELNQYIVKS